MFMNLTKFLMKTVFLTSIVLGVSGCTKTVEPETVMSVDGIALDGYDSVAYFESYAAVQADFTHNYSYEDLEWYFENSTHLDMFISDPERYMPAFGGFCAYELAHENVVPSNLEYWYIHDEKLYLFSSESAKQEWFDEISTLLPLATKQWEMLSTEEEVFEEIGDSFINLDEN